MCCGIAQQCRRVLLCSFAVGCEDSEDTGFCPLRIMGCAPEQKTVKGQYGLSSLGQKTVLSTIK